MSPSYNNKSKQAETKQSASHSKQAIHQTIPKVVIAEYQAIISFPKVKKNFSSKADNIRKTDLINIDLGGGEVLKLTKLLLLISSCTIANIPVNY